MPGYFKKAYVPFWLKILPLASGIFSALLGLAVIAGWYAHNITLLKVLPSFEPMRYNAAVCFFLSGMGLISAYFGLKRHALICAAIVTLTGLLTLSEYAFGVNLGIDELLFRDSVSAFYPGRMSPGGALGFAIAGVSLFFTYSPLWRKERSLFLGLSGSIVFSIGFTALFGYVTGVAAFSAWGNFTSMAAHTSAGFVGLGAGIIAFAWREGKGAESGALRWLPAAVGICVVTGTLMLWRVAAAQEISNIERMISSRTEIVKDHIQDQTEDRVLALVRMAKRWETHGRPRRVEWESDAGLYLEHYAGLSSVEWIDPALRTQWSVSKKTAASVLESGSGLESDLYGILAGSMKKREVIITQRPYTAGGGSALTASVPIFHGNNFEGFICGTFNVKELFDSVLLHDLKDNYSVAVLSGNAELYRRSGNSFEEGRRWAREAEVSFYGENWRVMVWPGAGLLASLKTPLANVVLFTGLASSLLLTLVVYFAQTAQTRAQAAEAANLDLNIEVAERKKAEEKAERHAGELEYEVAERKRAEEEVARKASELERSNAELEHFAYVASHDLQEPLRIISGYLQLLSKRYRGKLDSNADEFINFALGGSKRMQRMISDLLTYSRVGRASRFTHVDSSEVFDRTIPNLKAAIDESGAVITRGELPKLLAVELQLEHLFQNLIGNSIKYRRSDTPPSIHVSAEQKGDEWLFSFCDNGIGIDPKHTERIFVMFERLHSRDEYSGTGIGLALCKKIVVNHGGSIWVESEPGKGSTFYFTVPHRTC